jgi:hypothetical protein
MKPRMILAFVFLAAVSLSAQTFRGTILGTVTDPSGAVIAGAKVSVKNLGTGLERSTETSADGSYSLPELPIGTYSVTVTQTGFQTHVAKDVTVGVSAEARVDVKLVPGQVTQKVEVNADIPLVDTAGDTLGGVIEGAQATELPVNGRDFTKLLIMVPGATADPSVVSDFAGSFGTFSINGGRGRSNNYVLDGTDMNDGFRNDPAINEGGVFGVPATLLPVDAVAEFGVLANTEAEYGRNSGAIINTVTKSGTNTLHGSAFEDFRNDNLDARNYFNAKPQAQDIFQNNQFGGSIGGPIIRDHTFFYGAYEGQRERVATPSIVNVPTQAQVTLDTPPVTGINPVIQGILGRNPWGPLPAGTTGVDAPATVQTEVRAFNRLDSVIAKIDQHIGKNDVLTGRYFFGDSNQSFPLTLVFGSNLPGFNTVVPTRVQLISLSFTHVISPKLLVEVRGGWNRFAEGFAPQDVNFDPNSIGLATVPSSDPILFGLPQIQVAGISSLGASGSIPRHRVDTNWQYFTNFSYTAGKHNWKTGFEFRRTSVNGFLDGSFRGKLSFNGFSDFLAGDVTGGGSQLSGDTHRVTHQNNYGLYLQDGYRLSHKLTINYGLRWDYYGVIAEKHDRFSIFNLSTQVLQLVGTPGLSKLYPSDHKDFSPRGSVAYDLFGSGKTVLRAGYGLAYDSFSQDYFLDQSVNNGGNLGPAYNAIGPSPVVSGSLSSTTLAPGKPVFGNFAAASPIFSVSQGLKTPYTQNYNFNVEQQLGGAAALQIGYAGSLGRRLFAFRDINQFNPSLGAQPYPAFGIINQFESNAVSNYNSLQTTLNFHNYHGFTAALNYTWAHSIDTASDGFDDVPGTTQPDNSYNRARERADSNFDTRQRFSSNFHYDIPGGTRMKRLTSGWSVDGVISLQTGQPFDLITFASGNFNQSGEGFSRPDLVGNPFAGTSTPSAYLNLSAFAVPCTWNPLVLPGPACVSGTQHFGSLGRNAFHGPHFRNFDFTLAKTTALGERIKMQLRADFFNIFNHVNFANPVLPNFFVDYLPSGAPDATGRGSGFLPITATPDVGSSNPYLGGGGPRNIQLGVRFNF